MSSELTPEQRAALDAWENRALTPEEFEARVNAPMSEGEHAQLVELVAWFTRRYPTAGDRLAAIRRQTAAWKKNTFRDP